MVTARTRHLSLTRTLPLPEWTVRRFDRRGRQERVFG